MNIWLIFGRNFASENEEFCALHLKMLCQKECGNVPEEYKCNVRNATGQKAMIP